MCEFFPFLSTEARLANNSDILSKLRFIHVLQKLSLKKRLTDFEYNICLSFGIFIFYMIHMCPIIFSELDQELYLLYLQE